MLKYKEICIIVLIIFISFLFCLPLIFPLNSIVVEESYLQFCSYLDVNLMHLVKNHKIPFWAYHFFGGYPFIKHPENMSLSPLFYLIILPFGSANGVKLLLLFSYSIGVIGCFVFVRKILSYNLTVSALTTMFFVFNSFIPFQINTGNIRDMNWLYLPLIVFFLIYSKIDRRYLFYCACVIVLVFLNGFNLYLIPMGLFRDFVYDSFT